jgi:hypothetical protein
MIDTADRAFSWVQLPGSSFGQRQRSGELASHAAASSVLIQSLQRLAPLTPNAGGL